MHVAMIVGDLSDAAGGLAVSVPATARALEEGGDVAVSILGARDPNAQDAWRGWGRAVFPHRQFGPRQFHWTPALAATLRRLNPGLLDVQGLWTHGSRVSLAWYRSRGHPYVVTPRGMLDPWAIRRSAWKKRLAMAWFEGSHLRHAACLRATSEMEASHVRALGFSQPIAIVPNGIDLPAETAKLRPDGGRRRLLFVSRLHPKKGIPYLLRAWRSLAPRHPDWELVIAGPDEGGHLARVQALADELALPRVVWHPPVFGEAKSALYRSADLFVLPTHAENFGLVIAEALAHAVPVVTTHNAPWQGLETEGCGWWTALDDGALLERLDDAMHRTESERAAMGDRGREWMRRDYGWTAVARQLSELYRWVVGGGAPPTTCLTD